jgi:hypothetical protein
MPQIKITPSPSLWGRLLAAFGKVEPALTVGAKTDRERLDAILPKKGKQSEEPKTRRWLSWRRA